jgi:hypothetical protein
VGLSTGKRFDLLDDIKGQSTESIVFNITTNGRQMILFSFATSGSVPITAKMASVDQVGRINKKTHFEMDPVKRPIVHTLLPLAIKRLCHG